jgi:hypothetical protein
LADGWVATMVVRIVVVVVKKEPNVNPITVDGEFKLRSHAQRLRSILKPGDPIIKIKVVQFYNILLMSDPKEWVAKTKFKEVI